MEKSFDFGALLRKNEKKHKIKPIQLVSVAGGIRKRLETNIKNRKSTRLTVFDSLRNLPKCESPINTQTKVEHRRQQLEKWKVEKDKKKKEIAAQKKKPFIAGVPRNPPKYVPPPPPPKPSTAGRVTRSQTRVSSAKPKTRTSPAKGRTTQSFAPKNAVFKPPELKNLIKLPKLAPPSKTKKSTVINFEPVAPASNTARQVRSRPPMTRQNATEVKATRSKPITETRSTTRAKITKKPSPKKIPKMPSQSSSSSSDIEPKKVVRRVKTPAQKRALKETKDLTPKLLILAPSSSGEKLENNSSSEDSSVQMSKRQTNFMVNSSQSSSDKLTSDYDPSSVDETCTVLENHTRKSLLKNFSPRSQLSTSSSDRLSSDLEFINGKSPVMKFVRKSLPRTPKNQIPKSESSSEEKLRSPKSPIELALTPEQMESAKISPCVTLSRGKDNARKEMKWKIDEGLLDDDASDIESIKHFRQQLSSEIKRMTELCETWDKISAQIELPEFAQEALLTAVGQARLLMSQKLQQFRSLLERAARPEPGATLVTPADLHGFWDMVFMQIENVNMRFKKLEDLRARDWIEEMPVVEKKKVVAKPVAKKVTKPTGGPSRLREMIAAARKAKKEQEVEEAPSCPLSLAPPAGCQKSFEAGFFRVVSPVRSPRPTAPAPASPAPSLLKAVLSSEAKKANHSKNSTPFAMLRASIISKNMDYDGISPLPQTPHLTPLNLFATPGRSILKSGNVANKSGKKSIKVVLFDKSDADPQDLSTKEIVDSDDFETPLNSSTLNTDSLKDNQEKENIEKENIVKVNTRTRSSRKSVNTSNVEDTQNEVTTPRRSSRKMKVDTEDKQQTPSKQSSKKKTKEIDQFTESVEKPRKRSSRQKALKEANVIDEETIPTPKRSSRRSKALAC